MSDVASEYGKALFDLACEAGAEEQILSETRTLYGVFSRSGDYMRFLSSPDIPKEEREGAVRELLDGRAHEYLSSFLQLLIRRGHITSAQDCFKEYEKCYYNYRGIVKAEAKSAVKLSDKQKRALAAALEKYTGKKIELSCTEDPSLIGGISVRVGEKLLDGSIKSRLDALERDLSDITI